MALPARWCAPERKAATASSAVWWGCHPEIGPRPVGRHDGQPRERVVQLRGHRSEPGPVGAGQPGPDDS